MTIRRTWAALLVAAALPVGCAHTRQTEPAGEVEAQGHATPPKDRPAEAPRTPPPGTPPPTDKPEVPVTSSPAGLLKPGGAGRIQDKLADGGLLPKEHEPGELDGPTKEALRRFQRDHDLPATGVPDDATVRKLGLAPDDVFRSTR